MKYFAIESQSEVDTHLLPVSYTIDDLDLTSIHQYRERFNEKGIVNLNDQDDKDFLYSIGVFRKNRLSNDNQMQLTDGGLLFFGKYVSITDRFPRFQLDYQKYDTDNAVNWSDRISAGDMNYPSLNVFSFYNLVINKLSTSTPDKYTQDENLTRTSYYKDVIIAAKEALVNSLMHAYYDGNVGVKIVDRPSYFEFTNPGIMRVSKESFLRGQYSSIRNTEIAGLFRRIGISETAASGGPRILEAAVKNNLNDPEIYIDHKMNTTKIRIWKTSNNSLDDLKLTDIQKFIMKFANQHNKFSVKDVLNSSENNFGKITVIRNAINSLVELNLIIQIKKSRKYFYSLNTNSPAYINQVKHLKHLEDRLLK